MVQLVVPGPEICCIVVSPISKPFSLHNIFLNNNGININLSMVKVGLPMSECPGLHRVKSQSNIYLIPDELIPVAQRIRSVGSEKIKCDQEGGVGGGVGGGVDGVKMSVLVFPAGSVLCWAGFPLRGRCCLTSPLAASTHALSNFHFVSPGRPTPR